MAIKLKEIIFEGFKSPDRIASVKFSDENISIVYGDNGIGKTSLLKGLQSFLDQDEDYLKNLQTKKITCKYEYIKNDLKNLKSVEVKFLEDKDRFDWKGFEKSELYLSTSLSIAVERGISSRSFSHIDAIDIERFFDTKHNNANSLSHLQKPMKKQLSIDLYNYLSNLNNKKARDLKNLDQDFNQSHIYVENLETRDLENLIKMEYQEAFLDDIARANEALLKTLDLAIVLENETNRFLGNDKYDITLTAEELFENKDRIILALSSRKKEISIKKNISPFLYNETIKNRLVDILNGVKNIDDCVKIIQMNHLTTRMFEEIINELSSKSSLLARFNILKDNFNSFLIDNKKLIIDVDKVEIQVKKNFHSLDDLSSGERHILTLLVCILFRCHNRDFLFIDEPEMSLNLIWQESLLPLISDLNPDTQIIVASHSPFIVNDRSDYLSKLEVIR